MVYCRVYVLIPRDEDNLALLEMSFEVLDESFPIHLYSDGEWTRFRVGMFVWKNFRL